MVTVRVSPSATQRRALIALKRRGEATAEELARDLDISPSGVRQHMNALRSAGFVTARQQRGGTGRPADRYEATELSESLFVASDTNLSLELLHHLDEEGDPDLVARLFDRRRHHLVEAVEALVTGRPIGEQVAIVTEQLDAQGYLAGCDDLGGGRYRISLHSCALWGVAAQYGQACAAELDFIRDLLPDTTVERVSHKTDGAHACAYDITSST